MNGSRLLAEFREGSEGAFSDLVRQYTNLVYSVAKRRVGNDLLAQEVTQIVFIRLARALPELRGDAELVAWLHRTTVHVSIDLWRSETCRRAREEQAVAMQTQYCEAAPWNELALVMDEALNELNDADRAALLLRFFDEKTMREVGTVFGVSEDAAKMRVSRALDRLRDQLSAHGVTCSAAALGGILSERAVEAAPSQLVTSLSALKRPAAGVGVAAGLLTLVQPVTTTKLVLGLAAMLGLGGAIVLVMKSRDSRVGTQEGDRSQIVASERAASELDQSASLQGQEISTAEEGGEPDPLKLLQAVARARGRIASGSVAIELSVANTSIEYAHWKQTNAWRFKVMFDGEKRHFEQVGREGAYTLPGNQADAQKERIQKEQLSREAAIQEGLLKEFEARYVTVYDGKTASRYSETDGRPNGAIIDEPGRSGTYLFDPRCLGLRTYLFASSTVENCLGYVGAKSIKLVGMESVEGSTAWHVQVHSKYDELLDFWIDEAGTGRVLKHAKGADFAVSRYAAGNAIPAEVTATEDPRGRRWNVKRFVVTNAQLDAAIDPSLFTLAGLGMPIGTTVTDVRIHRSLGHWTGTGLSENYPQKKTDEPQTPPNMTEMLSILEGDPGSESALQSATWILLNTPDGTEVEKAADVMLREHIQNTNLANVARQLERMRHRCSTNLLEAMLEKNPDSGVQASACFTLATMAKDAAKFGANKMETVRAERLYERVVDEFGKSGRTGGELADKAKLELYELRNLSIGKPAPETTGVDLDGQPLKLSDFRGKVVVLTFWRYDYHEAPEHQELRERMAGKPFALLSINSDKELARAKSIVEKKQITWPSFWDGGDGGGPIVTAWNSRSYPNIYVLDRHGVIRYRRVYDQNLVTAVETLLGE